MPLKHKCLKTQFRVRGRACFAYQVATPWKWVKVNQRFRSIDDNVGHHQQQLTQLYLFGKNQWLTRAKPQKFSAGFRLKLLLKILILTHYFQYSSLCIYHCSRTWSNCLKVHLGNETTVFRPAISSSGKEHNTAWWVFTEFD